MLNQYTFDLSARVLGTTPVGQEINLGGLSGLFFEQTGDDGKLYFITTPDRGPNGEPTDVDGDGLEERPFPLPDYQPRLVRFSLDQSSGEIEIVEEIFLTRPSEGELIPLTGLPNLQANQLGSAYTDEDPVDLFGKPLPNDPFGADLEGVVVAPDSTYWLSDEYRPAIYHFDTNGVLIDRFIPVGTAAAAGAEAGTFGTETLPEVYAQRRVNRGFEALAFNTDNGKLYAWIQSPIDNPDVSDAEAEAAGESSDFNSRNSTVVRILEIDPSDGTPSGEYVYFIEGGSVDKIGDAVYASDDKFYVIERDSAVGEEANKFIFTVDLSEATNILGTELSMATDEDALEGLTQAELEDLGVEPVGKTELVDLPAVGYLAGDKPEGLALLPNGDLAVINDNDFGLLAEPIASDGSVPFNPDPVPTVLGIISFDPPVINEFVFNHTGTDTNEYVEIFGAANYDYDQYTVLQVEGDGDNAGTVDSVFNIGTTNADGFWTTGFLNNELENGTVTLLLVEDFSGSVGDDLDTDNDGTPDVMPWSQIVDGVAVSDGDSGDFTYADVVLTPNLDSIPFSYGGASLIPDGVESATTDDWFRNDFNLAGIVPGVTADSGVAINTPGESNRLMMEGGAVVEAAIYEIQGLGHISSFVGETVSTTGIVTAVDSNGFYLQDATGDDNPATSDGIFVFTGSTPTVAVGDEAEVEGTVSEFIPGGPDTNNLSITQISGDPTVTVLASGNSLPTATVLGADGRTPPDQIIDDDGSFYEINAGEGDYQPDEDGIDFYETVEGMRVTVSDAVAVSPTNRFGEIFTLADRGTDATGVSQRGTINISPDDFNPERIQIQFDSGILDISKDVNVGDLLGDVTGVVGYNFGNFEVNVTEDFTVNSEELKPEVTELVSTENQLTVAAYNVLNLDPRTENPNLTEGGSGDVDDDSQQFVAIANDIVNNLQLPDIIGLQEIQDNDGAELTEVTAADETLQQLVDQIEAISGVRYELIDNPFIGDDTSGGQPGGNIRNTYLYNPNRVDFVEGSLTTVVDPADQQTNPDNPFFDSRLPLVATFTFNGEEVTIINNHFSSKGGSAPLIGNIQPAVDLQENPLVNGSVDQRRQQADAVRDFVEEIKATDADANIIALGDFNEFEFISPLEILEEELVNLTETLPPDERYSYIFQGNSQSLDHILVSPNLADQTEFDAVHVNSEFFDQASDHDPLIARITFGVAGEIITGDAGRNRLVGTDEDDIITGLQGRDILTGGKGGDRFVYTSVVDAGDIINDFEPGVDVLDLAGVLTNLGYSGEDPIADGVVGFSERGTGTILTLDPDTDGVNTLPYILLQGVAAADLINTAEASLIVQAGFIYFSILRFMRHIDENRKVKQLTKKLEFETILHSTDNLNKLTSLEIIMNKFLTRISAIAAGVAASLIALESHAATISYNFTVDIISGPLDGDSFSGSLAYDDAALTTSGSELVDVENLSFNFQGIDYTEADGDAAVEFIDGEFLGLDFSPNPTFSFVPGFFDLSEASFVYSVAGSGGLSNLNYTLVTDGGVDTTTPEPTALLGLFAVAAFSATRLKKSAQ